MALPAAAQNGEVPAKPAPSGSASAATSAKPDEDENEDEYPAWLVPNLAAQSGEAPSKPAPSEPDDFFKLKGPGTTPVVTPTATPATPTAESPALKQALLEAAKAEKALPAATRELEAAQNAVAPANAALVKAEESKNSCLQNSTASRSECDTSCAGTRTHCYDYAPHQAAKRVCQSQGAACEGRCETSESQRDTGCNATFEKQQEKAQTALATATERRSRSQLKCNSLRQAIDLVLFAKTLGGATTCPATMRPDRSPYICLEIAKV